MRSDRLIVILFLFSLSLSQIQPLSFKESLVVENSLSYDEIPSEQNFQPKESVQASIPLDQELPLRTNVIPEGDFEEATVYDTPVGFSAGGSGYGYYNYSYQESVHAGSYSGMVEAQGVPHASGQHQIYRYYSDQTADIGEEIDFNIWYNITNPTLSTLGGFTYFQVQFSNASTWFSIFYMVSYDADNTPNSGWNSTSNKWTVSNSTLNTWNGFSKDLDIEFDAHFGSSAAPVYLRYIYCYVWSPQNASIPNRLVIDDFHTLNGTGYEYTPNGDFETGTGSNWPSVGYVSPSTVELTDLDVTEGTKSLNLSCQAIADNTWGSANIRDYLPYPRGYYVTEEFSTLIDFDWKYKDSPTNDPNQYAYISIRFRNETYNHYLYWVLATGSNDLSTFANYTNGPNSYSYAISPNFGTRDIWRHETIDLFELSQSWINVHNMSIYRVEFYAYLGNSNDSYFSLLIDDFKLSTYPTGDPGFEQQWYPDLVTGWSYGGSGNPFLTTTTDARTGDYALNFSMQNTESYIYRSVDLRLTSDMFTSFWWRIDQQNLAEGNAAFFRLNFGTHQLYYIVGVSPSVIFINSTNAKYLIVENSNQLGAWFGLHRNITADLNNSFGFHQNWNMTEVQFRSYERDSGVFTVLVDDLNFVRTQGPTVSSVIHSSPNHYYQTTTVNFMAWSAYSSILNIKLHYQISSTWYAVQAVRQGSINYQATIPTVPFGSGLFYFINATDLYGHNYVADNGGIYYSYAITDDIDPELSIDSPTVNSTLTGMNQILVTTSDVGSDIDRVEYFIDGVSIGNVTVSPYTLTFNTRDSTNGSKLLKVVSYDNGGNSIAKNITVEIQNDLSAPGYSDLWIFPEFPQYYETCTVSVAITDNSGVNNVSLHYQLGSADWVTVQMIPSGALYTAVIPQASYGVEVSYYVDTYDIYDQKSELGTYSVPYSYIVGDNKVPELQISGPLPNSILTGVVDFYAVGLDEGSDIDQLEIELDGTSIYQSNSLPTTFSWDTLSVENGEHTLTFSLYDNAGNPTEIQIIYQVNNPTGLDALSWEFSQFMEANGFIVGAGSIVVLYGLAKLILWRRSKRT